MSTQDREPRASVPPEKGKEERKVNEKHGHTIRNIELNFLAGALLPPPQ